jgi:hypothetical protein
MPHRAVEQFRAGIDLDDIDTARLQSPDSRLPYDSVGGNILGMGRDLTKNQTPDLFSTERLGGPSSDRPADAATGRPRPETAKVGCRGVEAVCGTQGQAAGAVL